MQVTQAVGMQLPLLCHTTGSQHAVLLQPLWFSPAKFLCWLKKCAEIGHILCICCLKLKQLELSHCSSVSVAPLVHYPKRVQGMVLRGAETTAHPRGKSSPCCVPGNSHLWSKCLSCLTSETLWFLGSSGVFPAGKGSQGTEMLWGKVTEQEVCILFQVTAEALSPALSHPAPGIFCQQPPGSSQALGRLLVSLPSPGAADPRGKAPCPLTIPCSSQPFLSLRA